MQPYDLGNKEKKKADVDSSDEEDKVGKDIKDIEEQSVFERDEEYEPSEIESPGKSMKVALQSSKL